MRKRDVATLGLSAPSRWNPLYRRWVRRRTIRNLTLALKALTVQYGNEQDDAGTYALSLSAEELAFADRYVGTISSSEDGYLKLRAERGVPPRGGFRILWDRRFGDFG